MPREREAVVVVREIYACVDVAPRFPLSGRVEIKLLEDQREGLEQLSRCLPRLVCRRIPSVSIKGCGGTLAGREIGPALEHHSACAARSKASLCSSRSSAPSVGLLTPRIVREGLLREAAAAAKRREAQAERFATREVPARETKAEGSKGAVCHESSEPLPCSNARTVRSARSAFAASAV